MKINTIIYASDLGLGSRPAFRAAIEQAKAHSAQIIYLHVVEPLDGATEEIINDYLPESVSRSRLAKIFAERMQRIEQRLIEFHDDELSEEDAKLIDEPTVQVVQGVPNKCIVKAAKMFNADLIVMGDRESSSLSRMFLGSTAQKVIHHSVCPVLIVPLKGTSE